MEKKRLYRNRTEKMLGGVCGGLAEFFTVDPTAIRLGFVALSLLGGHGILLYLILLIIVPMEPMTVPAVSTPMNLVSSEIGQAS